VFLDKAVKTYANLLDSLLFTYSDGYFNTTTNVGVPLGYTDLFLRKANFIKESGLKTTCNVNGITNYCKKEKEKEKEKGKEKELLEMPKDKEMRNFVRELINKEATVFSNGTQSKLVNQTLNKEYKKSF